MKHPHHPIGDRNVVKRRLLLVGKKQIRDPNLKKYGGNYLDVIYTETSLSDHYAALLSTSQHTQASHQIKHDKNMFFFLQYI